MLGFFPEFYPDELVYSLLARYYVRTGYMIYRPISEELFGDRQIKANVEYFSKLTQEVLNAITKYKSVDEMILQHTMYPYYARFYPKNIKQASFDNLKEMRGNVEQILTGSLKRYGEDRYLRYCPICAQEDKEKYGETYWHRIHQLIGIKICPKHNCYLCDSTVLINGHKKLSLVSAEEEAIETETVFSTDRLEEKITNYIAQVFNAEFELETDGNIGYFLHSKLSNTPYVSTRGQQRNMKVLIRDFNEFFKTLDEKSFKEDWQLNKVFNGKKWDTYHVCLLGVFMNIDVEDLLEMKLPEKRQEEIFDKRIVELRNEGKTFVEIAEILKTDVKVVQAIYANKYFVKKPKSENAKKTGRERWDWKNIDEEKLPLVKKAIRKLRGDEFNRPQKITFYAIEKMINIPRGRIRKQMPICEQEIIDNQEPLEVYWAREVVWAVQKIQREGKVLNWRHIRDLTNMKKSNAIACVPYLKEFCGEELERQIVNIVQD